MQSRVVLQKKGKKMTRRKISPSSSRTAAAAARSKMRKKESFFMSSQGKAQPGTPTRFAWSGLSGPSVFSLLFLGRRTEEEAKGT
jgi:hypothetical protein